MNLQKINSEKFISEKCDLENLLNQTKIWDLGIGSLLSTFFDNLVIDVFKGNPLKECFRECVSIILSAFKPKRTTLSKKVILACHDLKNERFSLLIAPIEVQLKQAKVEYAAYSSKDLIGTINLKSLIKATLHYGLNFFAIQKTLSNLKKEVKWTWSMRLAANFQILTNLTITSAIHNDIQDKNIEVVLVDHDRAFYQNLLILAAKKVGIKTQTLVHGTPAIPKKFVPLIADECLCWGSEQQSFFKKYGADIEQLKIVGFPKFKLPHDEDDCRIRKALNLKNERKVILYIEKGHRSVDNTEVRNALRDCLKELGEEWEILVKLHPSQRYEQQVEIFSGVHRLRVVPMEFEAVETLSIADLVLIVDSTFTFDSLIYGRPVMFYDPREGGVHGMVKAFVENAGAKIFTDGISIGKHLANHTELSLKELTNFESMRQHLEEICAFYGEDSARLIANEIMA